MNDEADRTTAIPFTFPIERGKVREFARAVRAGDDDYVSDAQAFIPPTFLASARLWQSQENTISPHGADTSRLLHAEQEYVFPGIPPRVGDVLTGTARLERTYEKVGKRGGALKFAEVVTEFSNQEGEIVAISKTTTVVTERSPE